MNVKKKMLEIEPNEYNVIQSLVKFLYKKPSMRKKKLFWYMFGEELLKNIKNNIDEDTEVCMQCGARVEKGSLIRSKCQKCRDKEIKELDGKKKLICIDCGKEFEVDSMSRRKRCDDCQGKYKQELNRLRVEKFRNNKM